jgi:diguanylate cyclase (GGDEF)-like protein
MFDAILLIQDVQLLCFTVIFGFVALQHPGDRTWRWLWYSFLPNAIGAALDFSKPHLPPWIGYGLNLPMVPLSYALLNFAIVLFLRRFRWTIWISAVIMLGTIVVTLLWSNRPDQVPNTTIADLAIGLQVLITAVILLCSSEKATRAPRLTISLFFFAYAPVEILRAYVALVLHLDPDSSIHGLGLLCSVEYVVAASVLPLAFLWMMNSRLESELVLQNMLDPLTHVLNRRGLRQALDIELNRHDDATGSLTVAMLDVDHFKLLNDTHGHAAGDGILIWLASLLTNMLRDSDTVARIGGEEFVVLLPHTPEAEAIPLLERLREEIASHTEGAGERTIRVTVSFGTATLHKGALWTSGELMRKADQALYRAKQSGRNRICTYTEELAPL